MSDFWRDRRVFVTGCTGLLGSWLTAALVENGADVVGLVRDGVGFLLVQSGTIDRINVVHGDALPITRRWSVFWPNGKSIRFSSRRPKPLSALPIAPDVHI